MKQLVMYSRSSFICPYVKIARQVFSKNTIEYHEIDIDTDMEARERILKWTGFLSVPTIVVANEGEVLPYEAPAPLNAASPKGVDRGALITEPSAKELKIWLDKHGFMKYEPQSEVARVE